MVSSALNMELHELVEALTRIRQESGDDVEYQKLRRRLPAEWPM
jgi:hypothetical protein